MLLPRTPKIFLQQYRPDPEVPTAGPAGPLILMSSVKHRTHDWDISTRRREVDWVMVVQRRGRDLKTSVIKL